MIEKTDCRKSTAIILPSLNPDYKFAAVVKELVETGFEHIVIVDDGSKDEEQHFFNDAEVLAPCTVIHHGVNKGKGRALKTAFEYVISNMPEIQGVVTIDGDGQHLTKDIIACGNRMLEENDKVIMGCRDFSQPGVPPRSVAGNRTTSFMFRLCYGIRLSDTQTGLRAIPRQYLDYFCTIEGERFEYETNMLLYMKRAGIVFSEQSIDTVYDEEDYSSHYNAVKDSWRIFKVMFKFMLSSLSSTLIDLLIFYLSMRFIGPLAGRFAELCSTVIARAISSFFNFNANNKVVFKNEGNYKRAMIRYYCLCIPQMLISAGLVTLINHALANSAAGLATVIKFVIDTLLFFISYQIQREWVFSGKKQK